MLVPVRCPSCTVVMKTPVMPLGTRMLCGRCRKPFAMPAVTKPAANGTPGAPKTRLITNRPKTMLAPGRKPVYRIVCRACSGVMLGSGKIPVGRKIKCLKCQKELMIRPSAKPKVAPRSAAKGQPRPAPAKVTAARRQTQLRTRPTPPSPPTPTHARRPWWPHLVGLFLAVLLVGVVVTYRYRLGPFEPGPIPTDAWKAFTIPGRTATIDGPGDFIEGDVAVRDAHRFSARYPNVDPGTVDVIEQLRVANDAAFLLTCADRPHEAGVHRDFDTVYQRWRDYVSDFVKGELQIETDATVAGHQARDFRIDLGKRGLLLGRVIFVKGEAQDRIYVLVAAGMHIQFVPGDGEKFIQSLVPE
jgi:hypothetical protein